jgi:hypothetical protein
VRQGGLAVRRRRPTLTPLGVTVSRQGCELGDWHPALSVRHRVDGTLGIRQLEVIDANATTAGVPMFGGQNASPAFVSIGVVGGQMMKLVLDAGTRACSVTVSQHSGHGALGT